MTDIVQKTIGSNDLYVIDGTNNTLVVDQTNARVGINNTNPGYSLTITGATHTTANLSAGTDLFLVDEANSRISVGTTTGVSGYAFNVSGATTLVGDVLTGTAMKWDNTNNRLGIGTTAPDSPLHVKIADNGEALRLETTNSSSDTNTAPDLSFVSAKKATGDYLGGIDFKGVNAVDTVQTYSTIRTRIDNPADGAEAGSLFFTNMHQGSNRTFLFMEGNTTGAGSTIFNYNGQDINFGILNLATSLSGPGGYGLYHDASTGRVGINDSSPASTLEITALGGDDDNPEMRITRSGVTSQYLGFTNEDSSGGIIAMHSGESNKKTLALESVHDSGGSAAGDNLIIMRTGAASGPTERVRLSDTDALFTIQSGTNLLVDDSLRVGSTAAPTLTNYSLSVSKSAATISGGLFSSSIGESTISNDNAGWWLTAGGMNTSSKYTPAIKFGSTDPALTTDNPKYLAGITGRSTETYSADSDGGMALDFLTFTNSSSVDGGPTTRMTIDNNGRVGIGPNMGSPSALLHVRQQNDASTFVALFEVEEDGASAAPDIGLLRDSTSPLASDDLGHIRFRGNDSGGVQLDYADMFAEIGDPTDTVEAGYLNLRVAHANNTGNMVDFIRLRGDSAGAVVINDSGRADVDFRIETDTNSSALFIDSSANTAAINVPATFSDTVAANGTGDSLTVADTLRIAQTGSGLRMTSVGAFDNDGSNNFRIFGTNDLILAANGETGTAITIDATNQNVAIVNSISSYNGSAPTNGQLLIGDTASGLFDAATLTAGANITITNAAGAITIAASGGGGGVTSVATSAPITGGTITGTGTIGITQASGGADGYLSAANWTTFNNKLAAGANISGLTNDANFINAQQIGAFAPPVAPPIGAVLPDSPTGGPLNPTGWLEIDLGMGPMYLPVYQ